MRPSDLGRSSIIEPGTVLASSPHAGMKCADWSGAGQSPPLNQTVWFDTHVNLKLLSEIFVTVTTEHQVQYSESIWCFDVSIGLEDASTIAVERLVRSAGQAGAFVELRYFIYAEPDLMNGVMEGLICKNTLYISYTTVLDSVTRNLIQQIPKQITLKRAAWSQ